MLTAQAVGERPRLPLRAFASSDEEGSGSDSEGDDSSSGSSGYESFGVRRSSDSHRGSKAWLKAHQRLAAAGVSDAGDPLDVFRRSSALRVGADADSEASAGADWSEAGDGNRSGYGTLDGRLSKDALWDAAESRAVRSGPPPYPTAPAAAVAAASADLFARHFHCCEFGELVDIARALDDVPLPFRTRYVFCMAPVDVDSALVMAALRRYARHMMRKRAVKVGLIVPDAAPRNPAELEELEAAHAVYDLYLWLARRFPMQFTDLERAVEGATRTQGLIQEGLRAMGDAALQQHGASAARRGFAEDAEEGVLGARGGGFPHFGSSPAAASLRELFSDPAASAGARQGRATDARRMPRSLSAPFGLDDASAPEDADAAEASTLHLRFERLLKRLETRVVACVRPVMADIQTEAQFAGGDAGALPAWAGGQQQQQRREGKAARGQGKHGSRGDGSGGGFGREALDPRRFAGFENTGRGGERYEDDIDALASGLHRVAMYAMVQAGALDAGGRSAKRGAQRGKGRDGRGLPFGGVPRGAEMSSLLKELQRLKAKAVRARQMDEARSSGLRRGRLAAAAASSSGRGSGGGRRGLGGLGGADEGGAGDEGSDDEYVDDISDGEDSEPSAGDDFDDGDGGAYEAAGGSHGFARSRYGGGIPDIHDGSRRSERLSPAELQRQYQAFTDRRLRLNARPVQRGGGGAEGVPSAGGRDKRGRSSATVVGAARNAGVVEHGDGDDEEDAHDVDDEQDGYDNGDGAEDAEDGRDDAEAAGGRWRRGGRGGPPSDGGDTDGRDGADPDIPSDAPWQSPRDLERRQRRQAARVQLSQRALDPRDIGRHRMALADEGTSPLRRPLA